MNDPQVFGAWLQRERERRGLTLGAVADSTKIGPERLRALERGDVSRWPGGIYRRGFIRAYAESLGLDTNDVLAAFNRIFPDEESPKTEDTARGAAEPELRLALAAPPRVQLAVRTACVDVACVLGIGLLGLASAGTIGFWSATAIAALLCHLWRLLGNHGRAVSRRTPLPAATPPAPEVRPVPHLPRFDPGEGRPRRGFARRVRRRVRLHS